MKKDKALVEAKNNRNGIIKKLNDAIEIIKSKVSKNYILSENSPEILRKNKDLILKTVKRNAQYLDKVSDDILLEELLQPQLPTNGIIETAFKRGYVLDEYSSDVLMSKSAKTAIIQYIEMQQNNPQRDNLLGGRKSDTQWKIKSIVEGLDESLLLDDNFREKFLDLVIEKGYKITQFSPMHLKQNGRLAENYYKDLLENNINGLLEDNILSPELLNNKSFLTNYINLLAQRGIDDETIIKTLVHNEKCADVLKNDLELFQLVFEQASPKDLKAFFSNFFNEEELQDILANNKDLHGKLLRVSQLYSKDTTILESLNGELLDKKYQTIPNYKMQLISKNTEFQDNILRLNDYEYSLYSKMTQLVSQKTDRWNRFDKNIVKNLSDGYYEELINDLYEQATQGNKITMKEIETLTFLLSKGNSSQSFNVFNITKKNELENFEQIKELVCDTILNNPSLDDEQSTAPISKYIQQFKQLSGLDRIKLALLEKYYNIDLEESAYIVQNFSGDIDNVVAKDKYQNSLVNQIKAIKNIFESNDIDTLKQVSNLDMIVQTDLSSSTFLIEQTKEMYEQLYKESLYIPQENEKLGNTTYNGKNIEVFDANINFSMVIKRIGVMDQNSQEIWNSMTKDGEYGRKNLRYYTSASYMTDENILNIDNDAEVILGFAQGMNNYSFDAMYPQDAHTSFDGGDDIYKNLNSTYMTPSTLETNTDNNYNEIVINTLGIDENGKMTKLQPDYIVYIKEQNDKEENVLKNRILWEKSKKVASDFGIPIVVVDKEKIRESEKTKIANMSDSLKGRPNSYEVLKFIKKAEHYMSRYGEDGILEYVPEDRMDMLRKYIEKRQKEEKQNVAIPSIDTSTDIEKNTNNKQDTFKRQTEFVGKNTLEGEEER